MVGVGEGHELKIRLNIAIAITIFFVFTIILQIFTVYRPLISSKHYNCHIIIFHFVIQHTITYT
ncbi:hypothetical protein AGMMS49531_08410 [Endomicrobiia bacterium]|nr:hypothetical protein AGMMS49531_08410 [Endomicrobiia bacterium]